VRHITPFARQVVYKSKQAAKGACRKPPGELAVRVPSAGIHFTIFDLIITKFRRWARRSHSMCELSSWSIGE
jgi:hypothetical protein